MTKHSGRVVALVGGNGFIGRALAAALVAAGYDVRVIGRHGPVVGDVRDIASMTAALAGAWGVVNLVGILAERGESFDEIHARGAGNVAVAAAKTQARVVHVSALGAREDSPSAYARSKAAGEMAVLAACPQAVILRPSLVLGAGSGFGKQIENLTRWAPVMPLVGGGGSTFAPVQVTELVGQIVAGLEGRLGAGSYVVAGPKVLTFKELVVAELTRLGRKRVLLPLPFSLAFPMAWLLETVDKLTGYRLPWWLLVTRDQLKLLKIPNVGLNVG